MARSKSKKNISSDLIHSKKVNTKKKTNPFELHINKEKLRILGQKQKNDKGLPGIARAKAIKKRKATLLQEFKFQNKTNKFNDKRIGERNHNLTREDKSIVRFTAVRVKAHNRKNIFNLADDEVLTHRGQTLSEIEKFDDPRSDDETSEENENGRLNSDFVGEAHFGGGLLKDTKKEGVENHKGLIEQLIAESKKRKAEKQKIKEATLELTEQLDSEWKDLIPLVNQNRSNEVDIQKSNIDDYDKLMRELKFSARGTVSDRLKTADEIAKEEKDKLEKWEQERLLRMEGALDENIPKPTHRSADDIEDDIYEHFEDCTLSYNDDGKPNVEIDCEYISRNTTVNDEHAPSEESDLAISDSEGSNIDSEDSLSDLKHDTSNDECSENNNLEIDVQNILKKESNIKKDSLDDQLVIEAMNELPFIFSLPDSYETLQELLEKHSGIHQSIIIERMIKCNHHSLAEGNKDKLGLLFAYLLQYLNDKFEDCNSHSVLRNNFAIFKALVPQLFELAQINPENAHNSLLEVIKEKHDDYRKRPRKFPGLEVLIFFKLVSILLPTSDFRHQVVTPCFVFIENLLMKCSVNSKRDISYGLFLVTLVLEFISISKRFMPAVINFLSGILHMAVPKQGVKLMKVLPPFQAISSHLVLVDNFSSVSPNDLTMNCSELLGLDINEFFKVKVLYTCIRILEEFQSYYKDLPSSVEIFCSISRYLEAIPMNKYPKVVSNLHNRFLNVLKNSREQQQLHYIVMQAMKPKALKMLDPKIVEVFDRKMHKNHSKEKAEKAKLIYKLKQERKGALREIRRDKDFLGRVKVQQKIKSDIARKEKVKRIYAEAASQQSELNSLERKRKLKK